MIMQRLIFSILVFALFIKLGLARGDELNSKYIAFVGEKLSVEPVAPSPGELKFDQQFTAKYRVLEIVYGNYDSGIMEFTVFDHKGFPGFAKYEHALIYIEVHDGKYYHAKYMYSPLFETVDGEWAGPYDTTDYSYKTDLRPEIILFRKPVKFDISHIPLKHVKEYYPKPYYRIQGSYAIAVYGNYVPELFLLKQHGVLRSRDDFQ